MEVKGSTWPQKQQLDQEPIGGFQEAPKCWHSQAIQPYHHIIKMPFECQELGSPVKQ